MKMPNIKNIKNMDKDELLGILGLRTKDSFAGQMTATLATFGVGLLVGAGVALLLAPKPGRELREQLRTKLRRAEQDQQDQVESTNAVSGLTEAPANHA
ncbi:MAG: YtxH domain-containing protein [Deltaproteobacteria bacterium]|nr:YtxH domain-containing protein [Deltaproteobacteria bacterium]